MKPADFVSALADVRMPSVFNPYSEICPLFDLPDAPARRRANLIAQIEAAVAVGVEAIWVGRDLGYRGGRRTGLALTDEPNLATLARSFGQSLPLARATRGPAVAEKTAAVIWRTVKHIQRPVFTWNVFPLHPHEAGDELTNRCHTRRERLAVRPLLLELLTLIRPRKVVAIGNDAEAGLLDLGVECFKVRHPSYGGVADFERGIYSLHQRPAEGAVLSDELPLF